MKNKRLIIIEAHMEMTCKDLTGGMSEKVALATALYYSARGTRHFHEALEMLSDLRGELGASFRKEFEDFKKGTDDNDLANL